ARVATEPVLSSATVKVLFSIAADTHLRDAASNARRHGVEQYRCGLPPVARGSNVDWHHRQFIGAPSDNGKPPPASLSGQLKERHDEKNGQTGDG
ncbi:MAG: hypothetical protein VB959_04095, partial [Rhodospirillales bacterium]